MFATEYVATYRNSGGIILNSLGTSGTGTIPSKFHVIVQGRARESAISSGLRQWPRRKILDRLRDHFDRAAGAF